MRLNSQLSAVLAALIFLFSAGLARGLGGRQTLRGHVPKAVTALQPAGRLPGTNRLDLAIGLPLRNRDQLARLLNELSDPRSSNYRQYLTPAQFTERFGPTEADYQGVASFAAAHGLKVTGTHANRLLLDVNGAVADIEQALHLQMRTYRHPTEGRTFYAPDREPSIDLTTPILTIGGLDNYVLPRPLLKPVTLPQPDLTGSGPGGAYMGNDFRAAYAPGVTLTGAGQTVGLVEFDSGYLPSDIAAYETLAGLTNVPVSAVLLDGYGGGPGIGNDEVSLDIEMAISMAPGLAGVIVYEGTAPDDILNRMATDDVARQIGASWNYPIDTNSEQIFMEFAAQGQSFFNGSGDSDAYTGAVPPPSDDPNITVVGGTTLSTAGPAGAWLSETVWNWGNEYGAVYDGLGSSGGISTVYPIPTWQTNINMSANGGSATMRNLPDVAMVADNVYVVYGGGQAGAFGGTSCATPLWAGFTALANQLAVMSGRPAVGFINPAIDAICSSGNYSACFHDITSGDNTRRGSTNEFYAAPGYDLCTGWGVPAGQSLINALATPDPLEVLPDAGFTAIGGAGGPFTTVAETFILTNTGTSPVNWSLVNTPAWLTVSPASGALSAGGAAANPVISLSAAAYNLPVGTYTAAVGFSNVTTGSSQNRQFILQVVPSAPPSIVAQPAGQTVFTGYGANFSVTVAGTPPLSYQWQFDSANIGGATNASLTLPNVNYSNAGNYSVTISNALRTTNSAGARLTVNPPPPCVNAPAGLISWWPAEGNGNDEAGFNNGALVNGASYAPGEVGQAFSFNGVNQYVEIADSPSLRPASVTLECWFNASGIAYEGNTVISKPVGTEGDDSFKIWLADGNLNGCAGAGTNDAPVLSYPFIPVSGAWHHTAYTFDSNSHTQTLYLDGVPVATGQANIQIGYDSQPLLFGIELDNGSLAMPFNGRIDETAIYTRALSATEIAALCSAAISGKCALPPTPPVIVSQPTSQTVFTGSTATFSVAAGGTQPLTYYWHCGATNIAWGSSATMTLTNVALSNAGAYSVTISNSAGVTNSVSALLTVNPAPSCAPVPSGLISWWPAEGNANDEAGVNNGVLMNGATFAAGEAGQAFSFNGTNQYIQVPDSSSLRPGSLTVECWFNVSNTASAGNNLVSKPVGTGTNDSYQIWLGHGKLYAGVGAATAKGAVLSYVFTPVTGVWYHVAYTFDANSQVEFLYLNGAPAAVSQANVQMGYDSNPVLIGIDSDNDVLNMPFNGRIDEVSVYNQALTASEISAIYQAGTNGKCPLPETAPAFVVQPESQSVAVGGAVSLNATATGTSPLHYQWRQNATLLAGATNAILTLTNVQLTNAGAYAVTASNYAGWAASSNAVLSVGYPPVITAQPADQQVAQGGSVSFEVGASGAGALAYQWFFHGVAIPQETNSTLMIANAQPAIGGIYAVTVSNLFGAVLSSNATLTVGTLPIITSQPASLWVSNGATATFSVAASGTPPLAYQWQFDAANISGATNVSVTLANVGSNCAGSYSVIVSNNWGTTNSAIAMLALARQPIIDTEPRSMTITAGGSGMFMVSAWSDPAPSYQWQVNGANVPGGVAPTLALSNTVPADGGSYSVIVSNGAGSIVSSNAVLTINSFIETTEEKPAEFATTNLTVPSGMQPERIFAVGKADSMSVAGGIVQLTNGSINYSPPPGYQGVDSYHYWLMSDSSPAIEGKVTVLVDAALVLGATVDGGQATLQFAGIPGTTYNIEASTDLLNWTAIGTVTAGSNGFFQFQDTVGNHYSKCYYRTSLPK